MRNKLTAIGFFVILLCAATAEAKGWRGIVPLHSTRSEVAQILGPPNEQNAASSVVYKTPDETVLIYFATSRPCGIGEKYSRWLVAPNTVTSIFITPMPGSPLSQLSIDESSYKRFIVGHLSETRLVNAREGEALTVVGNEVRSINYFAAADDSHLECPGLPKAERTNCEFVTDPFESLGNISFEQEKFILDNFYVALIKRKAIAYLIAYGGKRARPNEAKKRADRAKRYLVTVRHYPDDRIKVLDGGYTEKSELDLYVVFAGACPPSPVPTVDPRDVEITKPGKKKRVRKALRSQWTTTDHDEVSDWIYTLNPNASDTATYLK